MGANAVTLGLDISAKTENAANRLGDHLVFVHKDSACRSPGGHLGCNVHIDVDVSPIVVIIYVYA
jgi:hypothetical protein